MKIKLILICLFISLSSGVYCQELNIEQHFQNELHSKNKEVTSIECRFIQTRKLSMLTNNVSKEGTFYFIKPSNMLLSFDDGDFIKMTNEWFEMKTSDNITTTKITSNPMLKNLSSILSACVVGDFNKMSKGFSISYDQNLTEWIITLIPQRGKAASRISRIIINFDKSNMSLNLLKMEEKSGDYTSYCFSNKLFNVSIDTKIFNVSK